MRVLPAHGAAGIVASIIFVGCGGGAAHEHAFTLADAARIANVRPAAPGWTWPAGRPSSVSTDTPASGSTDPLMIRFEKQTAGLVDLGGADNEWQDGDKLAHLDVEIYRSSSDAHRGLRPFNALSVGFAKRTGHITGEGNVAGLGDEAWLLRVVGTTGPELTYHWRRDNVVIEAHMQCFGRCPTGFAAAGRTWAEAIDARARQLAHP